MSNIDRDGESPITDEMHITQLIKSSGLASIPKVGSLDSPPVPSGQKEEFLSCNSSQSKLQV